MWGDREERSKDEKRKVFLLLERLHDVPIWNNPHTPSFVQSRTCPSEKNSLARFLEKDFYIERLIGRQGRRSPTTQIIHTPAVFHTLRKNRAPSESSGIYDFSRWTDGICHTVVEACISGAKSRWTGCCWKYHFSKLLRTTSWTYSPNLLNHKKEKRISSILFFGPVTNIYVYREGNFSRSWCFPSVDESRKELGKTWKFTNPGSPAIIESIGDRLAKVQMYIGT